MAQDRLQAAIEELYAVEPTAFVGHRTDLSKAARAAGDTDAARAIAALRRPSKSAWIINRFVRSEPDVAGQLAELGGQLRAAERSLDGPQLRELSVRSRKLIDLLTRRAFILAGQQSPPAALRDEVSSTLQAALADPEVAARFGAGALLAAARWSGFGTSIPELALVAPTTPTTKDPPPRVIATGARSATASTADAEKRAEQRRRHKEIVQAERALTQANDRLTAAADAVRQAEDRVRRLDEQLADARRRLDDAGLDVSHATAQQEKARQAVDRLRP